MVDWGGIMEWITENKAWFFDGAGVPILLGIISIVCFVSKYIWGRLSKNKTLANHEKSGGNIIKTINQSGGNNHIGDKYFQSSMDLDDKTPPSIILGHGLKYDVTSANKYGVHRTLSVCIKNNRKNNYLSNCRLCVVYKKPDGSLGKIFLSGAFTLLQEEERYIPVASCHEAVDKVINSNAQLRGNINFSIAHYKSAFGHPGLVRDKKHVINLQLEYEGDAKLSINCCLWINEKNRLRLEQYVK